MTARENKFLQERLVFQHALAGTPAFASCTLTLDTGANMADGDTYTVFDGTRTVVYEFDKANNGVAAGHIAFAAGGSGNTAAQQATALAGVINANQPGLVSGTNLGVITLTQNWDGSGGNSTNQNAKSSAAAAAAITQWTGGQDAGGAIQPSLGAQTSLRWTTKVPKAYVIDRVYMTNATGFAANADNYWTIQVKNGSTVIASWSTQSTAQGAITAGADTELILGTAANLVIGGASAQSLSVVVTPTGSPSALPAGVLVIEGRYFA